MLDGIETTFCPKDVLKKFNGYSHLIVVFTGNEPLLDAIKSTKYDTKKRLWVDIAAVYQQIKPI